ncbi:MAG TPA: RES family NAD+ phosphorylase [Terriglobia bacterium]|nr:RES family NAD+ phosphorylase [Terriglobia bacterium]
MTPGVTTIRQDDTHRLIPSRYSIEHALARLGGPRDLEELIELDAATDDRVAGEANLLPGISVHELLFGVPHAHVVNAAFTHRRPSGNRFNGADRGAWYAAFELETAQREIAFHKAQELLEIAWREPETFVFHDYLADFRADFHDIRGDRRYSGCLDPESYTKSQKLASELLGKGSAGIVYPSVRHSGGTCIACFRPALVANVRQDGTVTVAFRDAYSAPIISLAN